MTSEEVLKVVNDEKISIIRLWFTDILGQLRGFAITPRELPMAMETGMGFDGSSVEGFARIHESDLMALPDPSTFKILGDEVGEFRSAIMFCDLKTPEGAPFEGDTRYVLRRNLEKIAADGLTYYVGPELEYFYFEDEHDVKVLDEVGYFDASIVSQGTILRKKTIQVLETLGIKVEYSHHEVAPSQHEIDLRYGNALDMADKVITYRFMVKEIARQNGVYATFMPKPIFGENGSGMHVHQSIFKNDSNLFFAADADYHLSEFAQSYIAGILKHVREITAVLNQWVNSYKRLVPGYEAPVYISWGQKNRSALVRVPSYRSGREKSTRIELRSPDPVCNPYLAFSVMLAAGMKGVKDKYTLSDPIEENIYEMTAASRVEQNIETLPGDLYEAVQELTNSELMRETLGDHVFNKFVDNKLIEWDRYRGIVSQYELKKYLPIM
ncbi:glutamine synthetase [candidate division LCP-89 bacterium B3_LCP]|uniref:Glutamine synthetase n=1 Tax=candidate division LCP-89 bacterium B3_LCP TaxID=2012998 RepID=A0A532V5S4_UNCL8|nr:MAG: glutamine synthetase [candidate division LCP-89 bacterium B3_LCP]